MLNRPLLLACMAMLPSLARAQDSCASAQLAVQVLGSGGPFVGTARASAGYLIWRNGRAIVLIDAGGGTYVRFGEAGARIADLAVVGISHLHPDHVADLPAFLWVSDELRQSPLPLIGPSAGGRLPNMAEFVARLFDATDGAFPMLAAALGQQGRGVPVDVIVFDVESPNAQVVFADGDLVVGAIGVPHADPAVPAAATPSIGYRVRIGSRSIVFGADQNGSDPRFVEFAADTDVLILHLAVSAAALAPLRQLHAPPEVVGRIARDVRPSSLVLSHFNEQPADSPRAGFFSGHALEASIAAVRGVYDGPLVVAEDLSCVIID